MRLRVNPPRMIQKLRAYHLAGKHLDTYIDRKHIINQYGNRVIFKWFRCRV